MLRIILKKLFSKNIFQNTYFLRKKNKKKNKDISSSLIKKKKQVSKKKFHKKKKKEEKEKQYLTAHSYVFVGFHAHCLIYVCNLDTTCCCYE